LQIKVGDRIEYRFERGGFRHEGKIASISTIQQANRKLRRPRLLDVTVDLSFPTHALHRIIVNPATRRCKAHNIDRLTGRILS
jgi:hypothetical protein